MIHLASSSLHHPAEAGLIRRYGRESTPVDGLTDAA
jgi:hypothetical protein